MQSNSVFGCIAGTVLLLVASYVIKTNITPHVNKAIQHHIETLSTLFSSGQVHSFDLLDATKKSLRRLRPPKSSGNVSEIFHNAFSELETQQLQGFRGTVQRWAQSRRKLRIAVIGGSMTKGHAIRPGFAYSFVLERILQQVGLRVEVHNAALGATGSMYYVESLSIHFNLSTYDFLIAEFSINDGGAMGNLPELFRTARRLNPYIHIIYVRLHHPLRIFGVDVRNRSIDLWSQVYNYTDYWQHDGALWELNLTRRHHGAYLWMEKYWQRTFNLRTMPFKQRRKIAESMTTDIQGDGHPGVKGHETIAWCLAAYFQYCFEALARNGSKVSSAIKNVNETGIDGIDAFAAVVWDFQKVDKLKRFIHNSSHYGLEILTKAYRQYESRFVSATNTLEPGLTYLTLGTYGSYVNFRFTSFGSQPTHCRWYPRLVFTYRVCNMGHCHLPGLLDIEISYHLDGCQVKRSIRPLQLTDYSWNANIFQYLEDEQSARESFCLDAPETVRGNGHQKPLIHQMLELHLEITQRSIDYPFLLHGVYMNYFCCQ